MIGSESDVLQDARVFDGEARERYLDVVAAGGTSVEAREAAGVSRLALYVHLAWNDDFRERFRQARALGHSGTGGYEPQFPAFWNREERSSSVSSHPM